MVSIETPRGPGQPAAQVLAHARRRRERRARGEERGAALFIVVLVITLLTAIGIFAARAASLVDVAAGYDRQAVQTQYLAEYGLRSSTARLANGEGSAVLNEMRAGIDTCRATQNLVLPGGERPSCHKWFLPEVSAALQQPLLDAPTLVEAGSLGPPGDPQSQTLGNFVVELTDEAAGGSIPGFQADGNSEFKMVRLTLTAQGAVRPFTAGDACDDSSSRSAGSAYMRSHVVTLISQ